MIETLRELLKGPVFVFAIIVAILGILRLVFIHVYIIAMAFYNSWNYTQNHSSFIKQIIHKILDSLRVKISIKSFFQIFIVGSLFILPFFTLDHISLVETHFHLRFIAMSKIFTDILLLCGVIFIISKLWQCVNKKQKHIGYAKEILFWILLLLIFISGRISSGIQNYDILIYFQVLHVGAGDLLIFLIPFSRIGFIILHPLITFTSLSGIWLLPDSQRREETTAYFKSLMEKKS